MDENHTSLPPCKCGGRPIVEREDQLDNDLGSWEEWSIFCDTCHLGVAPFFKLEDAVGAWTSGEVEA